MCNGGILQILLLTHISNYLCSCLLLNLKGQTKYYIQTLPHLKINNNEICMSEYCFILFDMVNFVMFVLSCCSGGRSF